MEEQKQSNPSFKSHILLPVIFVLTTTIEIFFLAKKDFIVDLSALVIWFYFGVVLAYSAVSIGDLFYNKQRNLKQRKFILIMAILTIISAILYATFYIIAKGRI